MNIVVSFGCFVRLGEEESTGDSRAFRSVVITVILDYGRENGRLYEDLVPDPVICSDLPPTVTSPTCDQMVSIRLRYCRGLWLYGLQPVWLQVVSPTRQSLGMGPSRSPTNLTSDRRTFLVTRSGLAQVTLVCPQ
jgi:hypothetical protein